MLQRIRDWWRRPDRPGVMFFTGCFTYFLCSQYFVGSSFIYCFTFYLLVMGAFLYCIVRQRSYLLSIPVNTGTVALLCFFLFVLAHGWIGAYPDQKIAVTIRDVIFNVVFLLMVLAIFHRDVPDYPRVLRLMIPAAVFGGVISLLHFVIQGDITARLIPFGRNNNAILAANVYAVAGIIAAHFYFQPTTGQRWKMLSGACAIMALIVVLLTQSRAAFASLCLCYGVTLLLYRQWKIIGVCAVITLLIAADYGYYTLHGASVLHIQPLYQLGQTIDDRPSFRLEIWQRSLELIRWRPWSGYGMRAVFFAGPPGSVNPHNLYLSTAFYIGIPGMILLLIPLGAAFIYSLRRLHMPYYQLCLMLLIYAVGATLTDQGHPVKSPIALWTFYWLPVAMAIARAPGWRQKVVVGQA